MDRYPMADVWEARASRNRAWMDNLCGRIDQATLFAVLVKVRQLYGQEIFEAR